MPEFRQDLNALLNVTMKPRIWAIFDVDRVLINTTSWFHACSTPDLLIDGSRVTEFLGLNATTYCLNPTIAEDVFRERTLDLVSRRVTQASEVRLKSRLADSMVCDGDQVDASFVHDCGRWIADQLTVYDIAISYLNRLHKLYGPCLKVLFLSAGYQPFIQGVVDRIVSNKGLSFLEYQVFGSGLRFEGGTLTECYHCFADRKTEVAQALISQGDQIAFAVDDDEKNAPLLALVRQHGGVGLAIHHTSGQIHNHSWSQFWKGCL